MRMTMMLTKMRMMTDDFPKNPLLHYGSPISGRDNLYFYRRVSGRGVALYHRSGKVNWRRLN